MGKNDFLAPKAISNRIKAKGLQKLRWYCQMCGKQCRDENGFKCHLSSDSHQRQMMVFGQNPERVVEGFTEEFEDGFMELLRRSHPHSRVAAKIVYNDYISDANHVHMNSTTFHTLTEFVKYLGKTGKCRVEETEKGWFISLIQEDPMEKLSTERRVKRDRSERDEEERQARALQEQIERAVAHRRPDGAVEHQGGGGADEAEMLSHELVRSNNAPLAFGMAGTQRVAADRPKLAPAQGAFTESESRPGDSDARGGQSSKGKSKMEQLMEREQADKAAKMARAAQNAAATGSGKGSTSGSEGGSWLQKGLIVKIMAKELRRAGLFKCKGVVRQVSKPGVAEIAVIDPEAIVQVHYSQLETVLPKPGGTVMVLSGKHRGCMSTLLGIDVKKFQAQVRVRNEARDEVWVEYEDVCKVEK